MQRTIETIEKELEQLHKQIHAATTSKALNAKDKRIILEGYDKKHQQLQQEKSQLAANKNPVFNCKVGKTTPIPMR